MTDASHKRVVLKAVAVVIFMLAFVFVGLVPMYNLICQWTGLTGKTGGPVIENALSAVDAQREIKVQFATVNNEGIPWYFAPATRQITVRPGEYHTVYFQASNNSPSQIKAQAIPSVSPFQATNYFHKTECFCFQQQALMPGEQTEMGLRFQVDPNIPDDIDTLTLSYTLFELERMATAGEHAHEH